MAPGPPPPHPGYVPGSLSAQQFSSTGMPLFILLDVHPGISPDICLSPAIYHTITTLHHSLGDAPESRQSIERGRAGAGKLVFGVAIRRVGHSTHLSACSGRLIDWSVSEVPRLSCRLASFRADERRETVCPGVSPYVSPHRGAP